VVFTERLSPSKPVQDERDRTGISIDEIYDLPYAVGYNVQHKAMSAGSGRRCKAFLSFDSATLGSRNILHLRYRGQMPTSCVSRIGIINGISVNLTHRAALCLANAYRPTDCVSNGTGRAVNNGELRRPSARRSVLKDFNAHAVALSGGDREEGSDECDDLELHDESRNGSAEDFLRSGLSEVQLRPLYGWD
jgi:hypothetical protein